MTATSYLLLLVTGLLYKFPLSYSSGVRFNYIIKEHKRSWTGANDTCVALGGNLVSFQNKAEEDHVLALLPKNKDHYWIGYNDMEKEGNFVWSDGSYYQPKYENWADGEPNDKDNNEDCTELVVASKNKKWNDSDCAVKRKFVCQIPSTDLSESCGIEVCRVEKSKTKLLYRLPILSNYIIKEHEMSWTGASDTCVALGGNLVSFQNKAEEDHVLALLPKNKDHYWIGYNDREKEGNFVWSDGSYYQPKYENWADGEPNDSDNKEDCTELIIASKNKKWNDIDCAIKRKFVCKIPNTGYVELSQQKLSWTNARRTCREKNGDLVTINNVAKNNRIKELVRNRSDGDYWIGLNDIQFEGSFKWVSPNSTPLFTDWGHRNEPNNSFGNEDCVVLSQRYKYEWNDRDCNTTAHFICDINECQEGTHSCHKICKAGFTKDEINNCTEPSFTTPMKTTINAPSTTLTTTHTAIITTTPTMKPKTTSTTKPLFTAPMKTPITATLTTTHRAIVTTTPTIKPKTTPTTNQGRFLIHPRHRWIELGGAINLTCSFYNTGARLYWYKDEKNFTSVSRNSFLGKRVISQLSLKASEPDMQGIYSCVLVDQLRNESRQAIVRIKDVSTTKMELKIDRSFEEALLNEESREYKQFEQDVIQVVNASLIKRKITGRRQFALKNIRPGSVLVDIYIYFVGMDTSNRSRLCSSFQNFGTSDESSSLKINSFSIKTFDCCGSNQTGEEQLKGTIAWNSTKADTSSIAKCPYNIGNSAVRFCRSNIQGAQWDEPRTTDCRYKSNTTNKLDKLSQEPVNENNTKSVSRKLRQIAGNSGKITNKMDVNLIVNITENIADVKNIPRQTLEDIINTTSSLLNAKEKLLVQSQEKSNSSARLLSSLQSLANHIPVQQNETIYVAKKSISTMVTMVNPEKIKGLQITALPASTQGVINISRNESGNKANSQVLATIYLPQQLLIKAKGNKSGLQRITVFVFDNDRLFLNNISQSTSSKGKKTVSGKIVAISIKGTKLRNLSYDEQVQTTFSTPTATTESAADCVFWDFSGAERKGSWSTWGCWSVGIDTKIQRCRSSHLTHFAVLMDVTPGKRKDPEGEQVLHFITYIGCAISLSGLICTFVTFAIFSNLRKKNPPKILMHLCFALIALLTILLAVTLAESKLECQVFGLLIHYFVLASFLWMGVEGINMYLCFVKILGSNNSTILWKASAFAWGFPIVIVAITAGVTKLERYTERRNNYWICMVKGTPFYVGYLTPILIVITSNFVVLFMVCHSLGKQPNLQKSNHMKMITKVRIIASLSVLMGSTWIFGLFAVGKLTLPFQMIFCALNSLQGFFIFTFYCARNKDVRNEWRHCVARIDQSFRLCCRSSQRKQNESGSDVTMNIYAINRDASPSGTDKCVTDDVL